MRITIVDDDADSLATWLELLKAEYPKATVTGVESLFEAGNADVLLMDISAVAPLMLGDIAHAWSSISKYAEAHPGSEIVIVSAVSSNCAHDVIDDCVNNAGIARERLHYAGFMWDTVKRRLKEIIP